MSSDVALWQQVLAAEHAAIWGFGLVGATQPLALPAAAELDDHRSRRTRCADAIVALNAEPVSSAVAYDISKPRSTQEAQDLAADLDEACTVAYAALAGADQRIARLQASTWLRETTIAIWAWSDDVLALPGIDQNSQTGDG